MLAGPDFLCIGMPKSGTTWLFDQLRHHPDFWMPPSKELNYLQHPRPILKNSVALFNRQDRGQKRHARAHHRHDLRDLPFLAAAAKLTGKTRSLDSYASLFCHKGDAVSGDITPAYGALPDDIIRTLPQRFPELKIVLLVRDPVARLWSHVCQLLRQRDVEPPAVQDSGAFRQLIQRNKMLRNLSFPSEVWLRWQAAAPALKCEPFFFDDLVRTPEMLRTRILSFLGADPSKHSAGLPENYNRKQCKAKPPQPPEIREVLVQHFSGELRACAGLFGGPARQWAAEYGLSS